MKLTFGRSPTYGEIKQYYTRNDILEFISDAAAARKVILSFKDEPTIYNEGESPAISSANISTLREHINAEFARMLPEQTHSFEDPLQAYPSFHFMTKGEEGDPWDFIMEADCPGWRRSFVDVRGVVEILHSYDVPLIMKFSGHRSLHLIIPREAFPEQFRDRPIGQVWKDVENGLRSFFSRHALARQAHGTGGLLRLPYSLNENTGMVSMPIYYEELEAFRPWESFHHLVTIKDKLSNLIYRCKEQRDCTAKFLKAALNSKSISPLQRKIWSFTIPERDKYTRTEIPEDAAELAWYNMAIGVKPEDEAIRQYRYEQNPDIRWFVSESLIGDEISFDLLPESDEYALCAIEDAIYYASRQPGFSMEVFINKYKELSDHYSIRGFRAIIERLDPEMMTQELLRRSEICDESELRQLIRFASIIGSVFRDWNISNRLIRQALKRFPGLLDEIDQKVIEACKNLESRKIEEIREAQRIMFEAGEKATEQLILTMASNKPWVRQRAMEVIAKMKNPAFLECLVNGMGDESRRVRTMAIPALVSFGNIAKPYVKQAADSDNPMLRANAIRTLGYMEGEESFGIALSGLESTNIKVRDASIKSLSKMNDKRALEALRSALWDVAPRIGLNAAYALVNVGDEGLNILHDAFTQAKSEGAEKALRCIAHGLVDAGDDTGLDYVISALYDELWNEWTTSHIIAQLKNQRGNDAIIKYFEEKVMTKDGSEWKAQTGPIVRALGEIEDERVVPLLHRFLQKQTNKKAFRAGIDTLQRRAISYNENEAIQALIMLLQEGNRRSLMQRVSNALEEIGAPALPNIEDVLANAEPNSDLWKLLDGIRSRIK